MIIEAISSYILDKNFLHQVAATLATYSAIKLCIFYRVRYRRYQLFRELGIPGPEQNIINGNLSDFKASITAADIEIEFMRKYGKLYGYFIGDEPSIVITDLDILKEIFLESSKSFTERDNVFIESPLSRGILFAKHDRWKAMRKALTPAFSKYSIRGNSYTEFIEESIELMINYIDQRQREAKGEHNETSVDIHDLMKSTALHLITAIAIDLPGVKVRENEPYVKSLDSFLESADKGVLTLAISFPFFRGILGYLANNFEYNKTLALIKHQLGAKIDEGLKQLANQTNDEKKNQVIDSLIKLHYEGKLSREEVLGNAEAILIAGYDTTSTTLTFFFWVMGKFPEIQEKLRNDLRSYGVESTYLRQVINETMRLYPTVIRFITRLATETVTIGNLVIPEGTRVVYNNKLMFSNPEIWPEPEKFDPERFAEGVKIHPCAHAPFGLGDRKCLGYQLAMLEMRMIACEILLRYRMILISPDNLELVSYSNVLTKPKEKVLLHIEPL